MLGFEPRISGVESDPDPCGCLIIKVKHYLVWIILRWESAQELLAQQARLPIPVVLDGFWTIDYLGFSIRITLSCKSL